MTSNVYTSRLLSKWQNRIYSRKTRDWMYKRPRIKIVLFLLVLFSFTRCAHPSLVCATLLLSPLYSCFDLFSLSYPFLFLLSFSSLFHSFRPFLSKPSHFFVVVVRVHYNPRRWNSLLLQPPPSFWLLLQLLLVVTSTLKPSKNGAMVRFYSSIVPSWQPINTLNLYRLGSRRS